MSKFPECVSGDEVESEVEEIVDLAVSRKEFLCVITDLNFCDFRSLRLMGTCEHLARLFFRPPTSWRRFKPKSLRAAP